ncbi:MAG TPA: hypothetical protein VGM62_18010 [Chthoniobacterales bacterium]
MPVATQPWLEICGIIVLLGLTVFFLATSWRKWPDALIDFGNNLYTAWRLANGAVLYRDVDVDYGPLSQYLNGALFRVFGPGMMILVVENLIVFGAIVSILYLLFRRAWGVTAAFAASAIFISVFGFSQLVIFGNYNYATPYSTETTLGLLICLLLILVLTGHVRMVTPGSGVLAGFLFGLTALLKPEIMLAAGLTTLAAALANWRYRSGSIRVAAFWIIGAVIPTLGFAVYFAISLDSKNALAAACHGWLGTARLGNDAVQMSFLGFDRPWEHLQQHLFAVFMACVFIGVIAGAAWLANRTTRQWQVVLAGGFLVVAMAWASCFMIFWREIGRCLLGLTGIYLIICAATLGRTKAEKNRELHVTRLLICVLAAALLSRMVINGRIYQYGYYQAAVAAVLVPAVLIGEMPGWLDVGRKGAAIILIGCVCLFLPGVVILAASSQKRLQAKTAAVGEDRDRFYAFPRQVDAKGEIVDAVTKVLRTLPDKGSLLVLPEGAMINYLARLPSPVAKLYFYAGVMANGGEARIVRQLQEHPPDLVLIISRDLREYGIRRYGESPGSGEEIVQWVQRNYEELGHVGGDPFDFNQRGGIVFSRKTGQ